MSFSQLLINKSASLSAKFGDYISNTKLSNGIDVYSQKRFLNDQIHFSLNINTGAFADPSDKEGVAHFLEHVIVSKESVRREFESRGGFYNAATGAKVINISGDLKNSPENINFMIQFLKDTLTEKIDPIVFKKEQKRILNEIGIYQDNFSQRTLSHLKHAFSEKRGPFNILGSKEDVSSITIEDLNKYRDKWFTGDNIKIALTGKIKHKDVLQKLEQALKNIPQDKPVFRNKNTFLPSRFSDKDSNCNQLYFAFAFPIDPSNKQTVKTKDVAASVLNNYVVTKFLNEKSNAYFASCLNVQYTDQKGLAVIQGNCLPKDGKHIVSTVKEIVADMRTKNIESHFFNTAKTQNLDCIQNDRYLLNGGIHSANCIVSEASNYGGVTTNHSEYKNTKSVSSENVAAEITKISNNVPAIITCGDDNSFNEGLKDFYQELYPSHEYG